MRLAKCLVVMAALAAGCGRAQETVRVSGQVLPGSRGQGATLRVELRSLDGTAEAAMEMRSNGSFDFDMPAPGYYQLTVTDARGMHVHKEIVTLASGPNFLTVRLPPRNETNGAQAVVSVHNLQRKVSTAARKELIRSVQALKEGDVRQALLHAERAVEIDPEYAEAYNDAAVCYSRLNQLDKALGALERARAIDPDLLTVDLNLSATLLTAGRYEEAGEAAGHALRLSPGDEKASFFLGLSLTAQGRADGEALRYLERAMDKFPEARLAVAEIQARHGQRAQAIEQVRRYQATADTTVRRTAVEEWLARLQR